MRATKYLFITLLMCCACTLTSCSDDDKDGDKDSAETAYFEKLCVEIDRDITTYRTTGSVLHARERICYGYYEISAVGRRIAIYITTINTKITKSTLLKKLQRKYKHATIVNDVYTNNGGGVTVELI